MTTFLLEPEIESEIEEVDEMGSFNHGYIQMRLGSLFEQTGGYTPIGEINDPNLDVTLSMKDIFS